MFKIRKVFKWEGAHKLSSSYSKSCQQIHGHSYICEVMLYSDKLNVDGMVVDFGLLKDDFGLIFEEWDHKLMLHNKMKNSEKQTYEVVDDVIKVNWNPTAENMAIFLTRMLINYIKTKNILYTTFENIKKVKIRVHETATGYAEYSEVIPNEKI